MQGKVINQKPQREAAKDPVSNRSLTAYRPAEGPEINFCITFDWMGFKLSLRPVKIKFNHQTNPSAQNGCLSKSVSARVPVNFAN